MSLPTQSAEARPDLASRDDAPLRDASVRERIRWGTIAGALWGAGLAVVALGFSNLNEVGLRQAVVPTFEAPVALVAMLGFALLVLPLVGSWVGLLLPLIRGPWSGALAGVLGGLPIVLALAVGVPWTSTESAATKLAVVVAMAAVLGGVASQPDRLPDPAQPAEERNG